MCVLEDASLRNTERHWKGREITRPRQAGHMYPSKWVPDSILTLEASILGSELPSEEKRGQEGLCSGVHAHRITVSSRLTGQVPVREHQLLVFTVLLSTG